MQIAEIIQLNKNLSPKSKELYLRSLVVIAPILICISFLIAVETPILFLALFTKRTDLISKFLENFNKNFKQTIICPLICITLTWILYALFIYTREVYSNMNMTSSSKLDGIRNTVASEFLKEKKLISDEEEGEKYITKSKALINQCFDEKRITEIFKNLINKETQNSECQNNKQIETLDERVEERIKKKLKSISKSKEFKKNYCAFDEYQLVYRIAYIVRNKKDLKLQDIFKEDWLKKFTKSELEKNRIKNKEFEQYFFEKIKKNDLNQIEVAIEKAKGAGNNTLDGGQILKYFAKTARLIIVTFVIGQVEQFFEKIFKILEIEKFGFLNSIIEDEDYRKVFVKFISLVCSIVIFLILYKIFEQFVDPITQAHATSILYNLNSNSDYAFGVNKKENKQFIMSLENKDNLTEIRKLEFNDPNKESAIAYRILLNLAIHPLLEINSKDEFYISS
jgi:hypothetical protein